MLYCVYNIAVWENHYSSVYCLFVYLCLCKCIQFMYIFVIFIRNLRTPRKHFSTQTPHCIRDFCTLHASMIYYKFNAIIYYLPTRVADNLCLVIFASQVNKHSLVKLICFSQSCFYIFRLTQFNILLS